MKKIYRFVNNSKLTRNEILNKIEKKKEELVDLNAELNESKLYLQSRSDELEILNADYTEKKNALNSKKAKLNKLETVKNSFFIANIILCFACILGGVSSLFTTGPISLLPIILLGSETVLAAAATTVLGVLTKKAMNDFHGALYTSALAEAEVETTRGLINVLLQKINLTLPSRRQKILNEIRELEENIISTDAKIKAADASEINVKFAGKEFMLSGARASEINDAASEAASRFIKKNNIDANLEDGNEDAAIML